MLCAIFIQFENNHTLCNDTLSPSRHFTIEPEEPTAWVFTRDSSQAKHFGKLVFYWYFTAQTT